MNLSRLGIKQAYDEFMLTHLFPNVFQFTLAHMKQTACHFLRQCNDTMGRKSCQTGLKSDK